MLSLIFYHIVARGVRRGFLFKREADFQRFLNLAGEIAMEMGVKIVDYCLMDNHYHLLIACNKEIKSKFLQRLNHAYALAYNLATNQSGHVFEERGRAFERWGLWLLAHVARYIALNPVKAAMKLFPQHYRWSAYPIIIGLKDAPEWLDPTPVLKCFSEDVPTARILYRNYVESLMSSLPAIEAARERLLRRKMSGIRSESALYVLDYAALTSEAMLKVPAVHELHPCYDFDETDLQVFAMREVAEASGAIMAAVLDVTRQAVSKRERRISRLFQTYPELQPQVEKIVRDALSYVPQGCQIDRRAMTT